MVIHPSDKNHPNHKGYGRQTPRQVALGYVGLSLRNHFFNHDRFILSQLSHLTLGPHHQQTILMPSNPRIGERRIAAKVLGRICLTVPLDLPSAFNQHRPELA